MFCLADQFRSHSGRIGYGGPDDLAYLRYRWFVPTCSVGEKHDSTAKSFRFW